MAKVNEFASVYMLLRIRWLGECCLLSVIQHQMIAVNLLNLIPEILLPSKLTALQDIIGCILEITSGLSRLPASMAFWGYVLLPFGGLSCIAQTYSMIQETDLSLKNYVGHKIVQTMLAFVYYTFLYVF